MSLNREVVITGVGVVSPIGIGKDAFWESQRSGRSGVGMASMLQGTPFPVRIAAELRGFEPKQYVRPRKSLKVMSHEIQMGFSAATLAAEDAQLQAGQVDPDRIGVMYGSEQFYGEIDELADVYRHCINGGEFDFDRWGDRFGNDLFPLFMLKYLPNMAACHIGISLDARGPNNTITLGGASSLLAMSEAVQVIERGHADVMIAGGTGTRLNVTAVLYRGASNLSKRNDDPEGASRPFDADRDGMVNGEGAGAFVLESGDHARRRGATVLARVLGFGCGYEPLRHDTPRKGTAIRHSIRRALAQAEKTPRDVGHVNANGDSTIEQDALEAQAIHALLGDTPVTAPKSFFGYLGAGSGIVEMASSVLAFDQGQLPPTLNYERPDPECPVNVVHGEPAPLGRPVAVVLNQSHTGQAVAAVLAAPE